jgi:hypothetical protein
MTHPHQLHALAALWSLRAARQRLTIAAAIEDRENALAALEPADGLRSQTYGSRGGSGGHGDPVAGAALTVSTSVRTNRAAALDRRILSTLSWLADSIAGQLGAHRPDPDVLLTQLVTGLSPATAAHLTRWVTEADQQIRKHLGLGQDLMPAPGNRPCPACQVRQLYVQTSAPIASEHTIVCRAGCLCRGDGCTCDMPVKVQGVAHIWFAQTRTMAS